MCLSIPGKVIAIKNDVATVSIGGTEVDASLALLEDVRVGEYLLVHSGFALQRISEEEALKTLELIRDIEESADTPPS